MVPARSIAITRGACAPPIRGKARRLAPARRTPIRLFDATNSRRPALLAPGDQVVWEAIDRATYDELDTQNAAGHF